MLEINLLPVELRPKEHTPYPRFILIAASVAVAMIELFAIIHYKSFKINHTRDLVTALEEQNKELQKKAEQVDELKKRTALIDERVKEVAKLEKNKVFFYTELRALSRNLPAYATVRGKLEIQKTKILPGNKEKLAASMEMIASGTDISRADECATALRTQKKDFSMFYEDQEELARTGVLRLKTDGATVTQVAKNQDGYFNAEKAVYFKIDASSNELKGEAPPPAEAPK